MNVSAADISREWERQFRSSRPDPATVGAVLSFVSRWLFAQTRGRARCLCDEDREDIASEVVVRAFRLIDRFDGRSRFSTWVIGIAGKVLQEHDRRDRRDGTTSLDYGVHPNCEPREIVDPLNAEDAVVSRIWAGEMLDRLNDYQRRAVVLRIYHQLSNAEIADRLNKTPNAIQQVLQGAFEKLGRRKEGGR